MLWETGLFRSSMGRASERRPESDVLRISPEKLSVTAVSSPPALEER